ncbi:MAG: hypothetical protein EB117_18030, partial [Betaproteobacteria bacterium]|nr:hypothetical protein [Betaproteobacteria bacterium]
MTHLAVPPGIRFKSPAPHRMNQMSDKMTTEEAASLQEAINEYESWGSLVAQQIAANLRSILE